MKKIGWVSAAAIVIANMIGTGVFTTLGKQLESLHNTWTILSLWLIGGVISLFGAFSYAELGTRFPRSGGEYHFLSKLYHPFIGYLSGWVSLTVGFAASVALSAMAMGAYLVAFIPLSSKVIAAISIMAVSIVHSYNIRQSSRVQNVLTLLKIALVVFFIIGAFVMEPSHNAIDWSAGWQKEMFSPSYAVALVYVMYAFSGWNAAAYIVEEIRAPKRNLPRALIWGTLLVSVLFLLLQWAFLRQATVAQLRNNVEVGQIVAEMMFGTDGGRLISGLIAMLLIAGISAMTWVGPRVTRTMANDYWVWQSFARDNRFGIPVRATWLQSAISLFMVFTSSFEQVLIYSGFVLQLITTLTVFGVFIGRRRGGQKQFYRSWGYPWIQIIYLAFSIWMLVYLVIDKPYESAMGLTNLLLGAISYWWSKEKI
ncbi:MAG: amino acid permease [Saprospiraceae bacterium]|nr:amino acid permease [Lewinella sp.]